MRHMTIHMLFATYGIAKLFIKADGPDLRIQQHHLRPKNSGFPFHFLNQNSAEAMLSPLLFHRQPADTHDPLMAVPPI